MAKWITRVLRRIRSLVSEGRYRFTLKAKEEMAAFPTRVYPEDIVNVLLRLEQEDLDCRIRSDRNEWLYVFKLEFAGQEVYLKVVLRDECVVISFHEDQDQN